MDVIARLKEALKSGEIIKIVYYGGSQPGTCREITPLRILDDEVTAKCYQSDSIKTFKIAKIELVTNEDTASTYRLISKLSNTKKNTIRLKEKEATAGPLSGKVFLFTGALKTITRDEAKEIVESLGGEAASSLSKKVDYVVAGEEPGSKYDKAKDLGLRIIDEDEFRRMSGK